MTYNASITLSSMFKIVCIDNGICLYIDDTQSLIHQNR